MIAFTPNGPVQSFTAATPTAPTSVQAVSGDQVGSQQYVLTNTDGTNDVIVGWGASDTEAKLNAANGSSVKSCYYLLRGTVQVVTGPRDAFFTGISVAGTAIVKVQPGYGN